METDNLMQPPPPAYENLAPDYDDQDLAYGDDEFDREFGESSPNSRGAGSKPFSNPVFSEGSANIVGNSTSLP